MTMRCMQGRFLLSPGQESSRIILGVLGRSLQLYGHEVKLLFGGGTSNHLHLIVASLSSSARAAFKKHFKTNLSKELGLKLNWPEHLFGRRTTDITIADEEALMGRVYYCARHGFKERLLGEHERWPGVQWVNAVAKGVPLKGVWYDRTAHCRAEQRWLRLDKRSRGRKPTLRQFAETLEVPLEPLPCMRGLSPSEQQARWAEIIVEAQRRYPQPSGPVLGAAKLLAQDPHTRPAKMKRSPAPACHGSSAEVIQAWKDRYARFVESYRDAWRRLREELSVPASQLAFPQGGVPPTWPNTHLTLAQQPIAAPT